MQPGGCEDARAEGLRLAVATAGGYRPLARRLRLSASLVHKWRDVPQGRLFDVARAVGIAAELIRPDLAPWIEHQRQMRYAAQSAMRRAAILIRPMGQAVATPEEARRDEDLLDVLTVLQAVRFAAGERGLAEAKVLAGAARDAESARAYAMALADVAGGVSPTRIAAVFGCSRQNVNNCSVRYLRARDGDDAEDLDAAGRVIERGRLRKAKEGDRALWDAEARFLAKLTGDGR